VNTKRTTLVMGIALITGLCSTAQSAEFFTDRGSMWYGGSLCYLSEYVRGQQSPMNIIMMSPVIRFFPARYLVLSPAFSWENMSQSSSYSGTSSSNNSGTFTIGPELGFAYGNNIHVVPYVISGIKYAHSYSSSTYSGTYSETSSSGADGYRIPLFAGIMVPFIDGLGIQVETGFTYNHLRYYSDASSLSLQGTSQDMSTFSISVGVCGVGKNTAISFLNTLTDLLF
jgi:hypothetical protein